MSGQTKQNIVVMASGNTGKLLEFARLLAPLDMQVQSQSVFDVPEVPEDGLSFVENAIIKARAASKYTQLPALGDDSGLEVDYLNGAPGIYSARYAGPQNTPGADANNNQKLLEALHEVPEAKRTARFQCVLVYMRHWQDPTPLICQGSWEGVILSAPRGENGFGYDPLFYLPEHGCSSAELDADEKNRSSHRAHASIKLLAALRS
jgi:XTP/dITP diphosphohydrolase